MNCFFSFWIFYERICLLCIFYNLFHLFLRFWPLEFAYHPRLARMKMNMCAQLPQGAAEASKITATPHHTPLADCPYAALRGRSAGEKVRRAAWKPRATGSLAACVGESIRRGLLCTGPPSRLALYCAQLRQQSTRRRPSLTPHLSSLCSPSDLFLVTRSQFSLAQRSQVSISQR